MLEDIALEFVGRIFICGFWERNFCAEPGVNPWMPTFFCVQLILCSSRLRFLDSLRGFRAVGLSDKLLVGDLLAALHGHGSGWFAGTFLLRFYRYISLQPSSTALFFSTSPAPGKLVKSLYLAGGTTATIVLI